MDFRQWSGDEPDPHPDGRREEETRADVCDRPGCDRTLNMFFVSIAGVGQFCSRLCADQEQAKVNQVLAHASGEKK